jgi:hypothetical protein
VQNLPENNQASNEAPAMSKKAIKRRQKLIQKKLAQGLKTFSKQENKKISSFVSSDQPTSTLLVLYFGNGQEEDYSAVSSAIEAEIPQFSENGEIQENSENVQEAEKSENVKNWNLDVFPGFMHGFIEFNEVEHS